MYSTHPSPKPLLALLFFVTVLHGVMLFFQTFSEEISHSLSQSSAGLRLIFETTQQKVLKPLPIVKKSPVPQKTMERVETPSTSQVVTNSSVKSALTQNVKLIYLGELRELIEQKKIYPLQAKRLGQTGTVEVTFTLTADGHIMNARVSRESPYERLNQAALATVNEVRHFKPIPAEIGEDSMTVIIPMRYSLYQ